MVVSDRPGRSKAGRRPGNPDTRSVILEAARSEFVAKGFDKSSMRGIAKVAGVDPALVHHYFDSKDDLLLASLEFPFDPRQMLPKLAEGGVENLGRAIATTFLTIWDDEVARGPMVAMLKASMASEAAANLVRDGIVRMVLGPISTAIDTPDALLRAQCVVSQLLGLAFARYILALEPIASTPADELVRRLGPTLQGYINGPLPPPADLG